MSTTKHFIPAQPGWLALFEETEGDEVVIHSEPVVAWSLEEDDDAAAHHAVSYGHAVIGAGPWIHGADGEKSARLFALVRESQLEPDFTQELAERARYTREELLARAAEHNESRRQGHASWMHERRSHRGDRVRSAPSQLF